MNSWNASDESQVIDAESLPAIVQLPEELSKDGEDLLKKIWNVAKGIADKELEIQREALKQAEAANQLKVEEAFKFSEAQALKIERLEESLAHLNDGLAKEKKNHTVTSDKLNDAEKENVGLFKDNEQFKHEIDALKITITELKKQYDNVEQEKRTLEKRKMQKLSLWICEFIICKLLWIQYPSLMIS